MSPVTEHCAAGLHVRDAVERYCLECGDENDQGVPVEPPRGSVVMTQGPTGTAWQRFYGDGRWHSTTGKSTTWDKLRLADKPTSRTTLLYLPPKERPGFGRPA